MRRALILLALALWPALVVADYVDPYGLPSGSASLALATQSAIQSGEPVEAYDFAAPELLEAAYLDQVNAGIADLVFFELEPEGEIQYLRPFEGADGFDRLLIASLGSVDLAEIAGMEDVELGSHVEAVPGDSYVLLQIREGFEPETTAVKFRVTATDGAALSFDWAWQPNGSLYFVPSAAEVTSFGELKSRW